MAVSMKIYSDLTLALPLLEVISSSQFKWKGNPGRWCLKAFRPRRNRVLSHLINILIILPRGRARERSALTFRLSKFFMPFLCPSAAGHGCQDERTFIRFRGRVIRCRGQTNITSAFRLASQQPKTETPVSVFQTYVAATSGSSSRWVYPG
jgi:hypothetical protein